MRTLLALALVLVACGRRDRPDDRATHDAAPSLTRPTGPAPVVLRVARGGGTVRAYAYPKLDSAVWSSPTVSPAPDRVLAFDDDAGHLAFVDVRGFPARLDLRAGTLTVTRKPKFVRLASVDGRSIYGVTDSGHVARLTTSGRWSYKGTQRARDVLPQDDGSLLIAGEDDGAAVLWHIWPPDTRLVDTVEMPRAARARRMQAGDRIVFVGDSVITAVRARDLVPVPTTRMGGLIGAIVATPSGDRLYLLMDGRPELRVVDRYRDGDVDTIQLPGVAIDLRMDPVGRYLLARPAHGDSAWVIALGTQRVIGNVATTWRTDLPLVAPDGRLALAAGADVRFVEAETLRPGAIVRGGARDFWTFIVWDGFRPRDSSLDAPVHFETRDTTRDSLVDPAGAFSAPPPSAEGGSGAAPASPPAAVAGQPAPAATPSVRRNPGFVLSFATVLSEQNAREQAARIRDGESQARVVATTVNGRAMFRIILGPYASRGDAERAGARVGQPHWVFEGAP